MVWPKTHLWSKPPGLLLTAQVRAPCPHAGLTGSGPPAQTPGQRRQNPTPPRKKEESQSPEEKGRRGQGEEQREGRGGEESGGPQQGAHKQVLGA